MATKKTADPSTKPAASHAQAKESAVPPPPEPTTPKPATRNVSKKEARKKNPKGGLTAAGRKAFAKKDGSRLRPGVQGPADTPEKQKRKGSFLRRHFANPRGPMERDGKPTRLALSAQAWGEPVPKTEADAKQLAAKGAKLLEQYHAAMDEKHEKIPSGDQQPKRRQRRRKPR